MNIMAAFDRSKFSEDVLRSGVAPVYFMHPEEVRHRRAADGR